MINGKSHSHDGQTVIVAAANSTNTGGTSTASDGSHAANSALLGQHMASSFARAAMVTVQHRLPINRTQPPLLAQPHA